MLTIKDLIELQNDIPEGLIITGKNRNTKLMFHKVDPKLIDFNPHFNLYGFQEMQKQHHNTFFANTKFVLSFWYDGSSAEFIGTYKLGEPIIDRAFHLKSDKVRDRYRFPDMIEIDFLSEFKNRLFINWTNPTAAYGRWVENDKYELHSLTHQTQNTIGHLPLGYYRIKLDYLELTKLYDYPDDNITWKEYLSSRSGVYLIMDKSDGKLYVGSASGENGFYGRWEDYKKSGHGGNELLKERDCRNFQFSILHEELNTYDKDKLKAIEGMFMRNLGTVEFGLNTRSSKSS